MENSSRRAPVAETTTERCHRAIDPWPGAKYSGASGTWIRLSSAHTRWIIGTPAKRSRRSVFMKDGIRVYDTDTHIDPGADVLEKYVDRGSNS